MSRSIPYTMTCACEATFTATVYEAVNVTLEPQLLYTLLAGLLNVATCPNCGRRAAIARSFLYHDVACGLFAYVHPRTDLPDEQREQLLQQLRRVYGLAVEQSAQLQERQASRQQRQGTEEANAASRPDNAPLAEPVPGGPSTSNTPPLQVIFGVEQLCALVNSLLAPDERLGKLALSSKGQGQEERQRLLRIARQMAGQMECQVEVDEEPGGEYTVWLYGSRRAIGAMMRELAPRQ